MSNRIFKLLDHPWIQRASAAWFIAGVLVFAIHLAEEGLKRVDALNVLGIVLMATGLLGLFASWLRGRNKPLMASSRLDNSRLWAEVYGEEQKERQRRAQQLAKKNVDREV